MKHKRGLSPLTKLRIVLFIILLESNLISDHRIWWNRILVVILGALPIYFLFIYNFSSHNVIPLAFGHKSLFRHHYRHMYPLSLLTSSSLFEAPSFYACLSANWWELRSLIRVWCCFWELCLYFPTYNILLFHSFHLFGSLTLVASETTCSPYITKDCLTPMSTPSVFFLILQIYSCWRSIF